MGAKRNPGQGKKAKGGPKGCQEDGCQFCGNLEKPKRDTTKSQPTMESPHPKATLLRMALTIIRNNQLWST